MLENETKCPCFDAGGCVSNEAQSLYLELTQMGQSVIGYKKLI